MGASVVLYGTGKSCRLILLHTPRSQLISLRFVGAMLQD